MKLLDSEWPGPSGAYGVRETGSQQFWDAYDTALVPNVLMHDVVLGKPAADPLVVGASYTMKYQRPRPLSAAGTFLESQILNVIVSAANAAIPSSSAPENLANLTVTPVSRGTRTIRARVVRAERPQH